ncbi:CD225/dispanin family protein [Williamsia sp.]|uniref:CD225/dispanin family protein n=1 Tax=Williamsia sp. TaxID=1872085 RepID=UPI001A26D260|nr:CD225/dispanin family protein [Williamsia sp.]MBJ7289588.1 CD225/dispanin family protein [Williamsia sp.]
MTQPDPKQPDPYATESFTGDPYAQNPYPASQPQYGGGYAQPQQFTPAPPSANGGWAVAAIVFFWPLAFVAVSRAFSVYPLWAQGRYAEAEAASATVKRLGVISLIIIAALIVLYIVVVIIAVAVGVSSDSSV